MGVVAHDFSPHSGFCVECGLSSAVQDIPCVSTTDDKPLSIADRLLHAITTAINDDTSLPETEKRRRHIERIATMFGAVEEIERLTVTEKETI